MMAANDVLHQRVQTRGIPVGSVPIIFEACSTQIRDQGFNRNTSVAGVGYHWRLTCTTGANLASLQNGGVLRPFQTIGLTVLESGFVMATRRVQQNSTSSWKLDHHDVRNAGHDK